MSKNPLSVSLARLLIEGDDVAQRVEDNMGLAVSIANEYVTGARNVYGTEDDEVHSCARIALAKAAQDYDETKGVPFHGYAARVIRNALAAMMRRERQHANVFRSSDSLDVALGSKTSDTRRDLLKHGDQAWADDDAGYDKEDEENNSTMSKVLVDAMSDFDEREQLIIRALLRNPPATYRQIASEIGLSHQRVFQIVKASDGRPSLLGRLKRAIIKRGYGDAIKGIIEESVDDEMSTDALSMKHARILQKINSALLALGESNELETLRNKLKRLDKNGYLTLKDHELNDVRLLRSIIKRLENEQ